MERSLVLKYIKWLLPWLVSIGILVVLFLKLRLTDFLFLPQVLSSGFFFLAVFLSIFNNTLISGLKYKYLLEFFGIKISLRESILIKVGSIPIKAISPFKSGEAVRAVYLKQQHQLSYQKGIFTIILGYILSISALVLVGFIGWFIRTENYLIGLGGLCTFLIGIFFARVYSLRSLVLSVLGRISKKWRWQADLFFKAVKVKNFRLGGVILFAVSLLFELIKMVNYLIVFIIFDIPVPLTAFLFLVPVLIFAVSLPITVSGLGSREVATVVFFSPFSSSDVLFPAGLTLSFVETVIPILAGLFLLKVFLTRLVSRERASLNEKA